MDRISVEKALIEAAAAAMERARAYILRWPRGCSIPPRLGLWALGRAKEERKQPQGLPELICESNAAGNAAAKLPLRLANTGNA